MNYTEEKTGSNRIPVSETLIEAVKKRVDAPLFRHITSVASEALKLSEILSLSDDDTKRVCTAAMLHDVSKRLDINSQISLAGKYGVELTENDLLCPAVIHSLTGALIARYEFADYTDEIICTAISCHTMGRPGMNVIDKIIFTADYIEPGRAHEICIKTRENLYKAFNRNETDKLDSLDNTVCDILKNTVAYLKEQKKPIHPTTLLTLRDMEEKNFKKSSYDTHERNCE